MLTETEIESLKAAGKWKTCEPSVPLQYTLNRKGGNNFDFLPSKDDNSVLNTDENAFMSKELFS